MARVFNIRSIDRAGIKTYYEIMGWDRKTTIPTKTTLEKLDIAWTEGELFSKNV